MSSAPPLARRVFHGTLIHSRSLTEIEYLTDALLGVNEAGVIAFLDKDVREEKQVASKLEERGWKGVQVITLKRGEFLIPGLIDTHTHAPQYVNLAYGQQFELLEWLNKVTFPAEANFADAHYARRTYEGVVQRLINSGTTTVCYYGTLHLTTKVLAAICHRKGQRAFVGKCNMDRLSAPNYQEESATESLEDTEEFISFVRGKCASPTVVASSSDGTISADTALASASRDKYTSSLVQPILTPRFAIACSDELLTGLGEMMKKDPSLPCQTHLAENPTEIEFTKSLFPFASTYTHVYDHFGLLQQNTVLAHCVHLDHSEMDLIKSRDSGVSHCPNSNFNLRSGTSKVADMLDRGIKVSLGTDVAGGTSLGILSAIRTASFASKTIVFTERDSTTPSASGPTPPTNAVPIISSDGETTYPSGYFSSRHLSIETLFYLATKGGAQVTSLEDRVGDFAVGKEFDALLVQTGQREVEEQKGEVEGAEQYDLALEEGLEDRFPADEFGPNLFVEPEDSVEKVFEKFLFSGDDRNLGSVFVRGRVIGGARPLA